MSKIDIKSMTVEEICEMLSNLGQQKFRGKQIFDWLHVKKVENFIDMTNISKDLIQKLNDNCFITIFSIEKKFVSEIDGTMKYLFRLQDGEFVESVLMRYKHGNSICISTQVGCKMGCAFCASTKAGFVRNLTSSEILEQIYKVIRDTGEKISNVVLMGIGEPLDNYDNVVRFLDLLSCEKGHNLSLRHVSLSTCGVVDKIYELSKLRLGLTLSISLHAPNNQIRSNTMSINKKWSIEELLTACREYANNTGRRISFEYALIKGINDSKACADELALRLKGMLCHVNLIPVNEIKETNYKKTNSQDVIVFQNYLLNKGINTTIRRTLGTDINAACGQLRANEKEISDNLL